jgi:hypothetical protein
MAVRRIAAVVGSSAPARHASDRGADSRERDDHTARDHAWPASNDPAGRAPPTDSRHQQRGEPSAPRGATASSDQSVAPAATDQRAASDPSASGSRRPATPRRRAAP